MTLWMLIAFAAFVLFIATYVLGERLARAGSARRRGGADDADDDAGASRAG